jgi:hypothetical protein
VVAGEDALAEVRGRFLGLALRRRKRLLRLVLGDLIRVVVAVQVREALQVRGRPGVFALQQFVDFALRRRPPVYGRCVVLLGFADVCAGFS